ncbi:MAG TPA: molybdopterin-dependent oxidoreductase [Candidatus Kapabacteria bacterium]|nr:molybdopterin-dependent oxidoreductase [Candidatus Kapabacteria bacterium]
MPNKKNGLIAPPARPVISRRSLIALAPLALLAACDLTPEGKTESFLRGVQSFNDWVQGAVFNPAKLSPELPLSETTLLKDFRVNTESPHDLNLDLKNWALEVGGLVKRPGRYTLAEIERLPRKEMNTRLVCVEGWSMVPRWGGARLADFLTAVGAAPDAKYVYVACGDGYYTSYDMASARHPQTLLCYEAYGMLLTLDHGAPLRIVMPTKLGYKSAKWLTNLFVTNEKPGGYWEDQGYDWFAGI